MCIRDSSYAASPLANEVTLGTAQLRALSSDQMRAYYRVQSGLARRAVEGLRSRRHLECSFRSEQGGVEHCLEICASESDLLLLSPRLGPAFDPRRSTARQSPLARSLLGIFEPARRRAAAPRQWIQVVAGGRERLAASLDIAARLAARRKQGLSVAITAATEDPELERGVRQALPETVELRSVFAAAPDALLDRLRRDLPDLVVLGPEVPPSLRQGLARLGLPLLELSR